METTKRCAGCGFEARQDARACPRCGGSQFHTPMVCCPVCGADVPQSQYCAHCGGDLQNPGAQVWHSCVQCGIPVHVTYSNCRRCGAANLPPVQPKQLKKRGSGWLALLLIPVLLLLIGIGVGTAAYLEGEWPQLQVPATTTSAWLPEPATLPPSSAPDQTAGPETSEPATEPVSVPATEPSKPEDTKPTEPATEPTVPATEPREPSITERIPSVFANNYFLAGVENGYCETMTGKVVVLVVFVSDPTDVWSQADMNTARQTLQAELNTLKDNADVYGADLDLNVGFDSVSISVEYDRDSNEWRQAAMTGLGMADGYKDQRKLETQYDADQVPVVFVIPGEGRAFATHYTSGNGFESLVVYQSDLAALRHELCHLFGARDMYFAPEAKAAAEQYLPGGIMFGDCEGQVDELTAFILGWTDTLSENAVSFLWSTNSLTELYMEQLQNADQLTGYGTKAYDDGTYVGYMEFGVPNGEGTFTWDDGSVYTGTWVNGERTGYGTLTNASGYSYAGYWKEGKSHGTGTAVYTDGGTYTGDFVEGERHGKGTYTWTDGNSYTGQWQYGERTGQGTLTWADGSVYTGAWDSSHRNGYGEMTMPNGFSYKGYWKNDQQHGTGTAVYTGGDSYTGQWDSGKRHGEGTYTWSNGAVYVGDWVQGQRTGKGTLTWSDGSYYTGDWVNGVQHGYGEWYYATYGTRYVGDFVNGKREGYGTYYYADGSTYTGQWKNDTIAD